MKNPKASQVTRDYFWNTASSVMAAASTVVMMLAATRVLGNPGAGTFAFALAMGQLFQMLGAFEVRPFQATDVRHRFGFGSYHAARILTVLMMLVGIAVVALASSGFTTDALLILLIGSLRAFDAFEDVFHGEFQRLGRLDIAGRAFFYRTLITTASFTLILILTANLMVAAVVTILLSLVSLLALNLPIARQMFQLPSRFDSSIVRSLLKICAPLFASSFLAGFLINAPRIGIETFLPRDFQTYFAVLFMPALVINLLSLVLFKPLLTRMALHWNGQEYHTFFSVIRRGLLAVLGASTLTFAIAYPFGIPILEFVFGVDLTGFQLDFVILLIGGSLNAGGVILYYAMVTMGRRHTLLAGYVIAAAAVIGLSATLIPVFGMLGASIAYTGAMLIVFVLFLIFFLRWFRQDTRAVKP